MAGRLRDEITQQRPFESWEQEALLNVLRTADALMQGIAAVLKPFKLSHSRYNRTAGTTFYGSSEGQGPRGRRAGRSPSV